MGHIQFWIEFRCTVWWYATNFTEPWWVSVWWTSENNLGMRKSPFARKIPVMVLKPILWAMYLLTDMSEFVYDICYVIGFLSKHCYQQNSAHILTSNLAHFMPLLPLHGAWNKCNYSISLMRLECTPEYGRVWKSALDRALFCAGCAAWGPSIWLPKRYL